MEQNQGKTSQTRKAGVLRKAKGLFLDNVWHCDCDPRLPSEHFQTKNGGKNHGRWFYTCQAPQHKRCGFFLWDDEAKRREKLAVLNNSRSEPQTPSKVNPVPAQLPSPQSTKKEPRPNTPEPRTGDDFNWSSDDDEVLAKVTSADSKQTISDATPETPSKIAKIDHFATPTKRKHDATDRSTDDVFTTVRTKGLHTPVKSTSVMSLTKDVLDVLKSVRLSAEIEAELTALLDRHDLELRGVIRGRDISREIIKAKDKKIAELSSRIAGLEGERETNKTVIAHLKRDIAETSPKARHMK